MTEPDLYPDDGLTQEEHAAIAEARCAEVLAETRAARLGLTLDELNRANAVRTAADHD